MDAISVAVRKLYPKPSRFAEGTKDRRRLVIKWMNEFGIKEEDLVSVLGSLTPHDLNDDLGLGGVWGDKRRDARWEAARRAKEYDKRATTLDPRAQLASEQSRLQEDEDDPPEIARSADDWTKDYQLPLKATEAFQARADSIVDEEGVEKEGLADQSGFANSKNGQQLSPE